MDTNKEQAEVREAKNKVGGRNYTSSGNSLEKGYMVQKSMEKSGGRLMPSNGFTDQLIKKKIQYNEECRYFKVNLGIITPVKK